MKVWFLGVMAPLWAAVLAPQGHAGWIVDSTWHEQCDIAPAVSPKCIGNGYGAGNAHSSADASRGDLFAEASDAASFCDITAAAQATCTGWDSWKYVPTANKKEGRVAVKAEVTSSGYMTIDDGPASTVVFARGRFEATGFDALVSQAKDGKATEQSFSVDVPIPDVGISINVSGNTHTGTWPVLGGLEPLDDVTDCIKHFTRVHRIDLYGEAWADGGYLGLDLASCDLNAKAAITSTLKFQDCTEPIVLDDPPLPTSPGNPPAPTTPRGPSHPTTPSC